MGKIYICLHQERAQPNHARIFRKKYKLYLFKFKKISFHQTKLTLTMPEQVSHTFIEPSSDADTAIPLGATSKHLIY